MKIRVRLLHLYTAFAYCLFFPCADYFWNFPIAFSALAIAESTLLKICAASLLEIALDLVL